MSREKSHGFIYMYKIRENKNSLLRVSSCWSSGELVFKISPNMKTFWIQAHLRINSIKLRVLSFILFLLSSNFILKIHDITLHFLADHYKNFRLKLLLALNFNQNCINSYFNHNFVIYIIYEWLKFKARSIFNP